MKEKVKICFLADKHSLYDDRIYWKMAVPLVENGFDVYYFLIGDEDKKGLTKEGIQYEIFRVKTFSTNRYINFILKRLNPNNNYKKLLEKAAFIQADIYHFHDLWINRIGKKLKNLKHNPLVFYDAREPYAEDYISYTRAKGLIKVAIKLFANYVDYWEKKQSKNYDLVISNEEIVRDKFRKKIGKNKAEVLYNYTDIYRHYTCSNWEEKKYDIIYCGGITRLRGAFKILEATKIASLKIPKIKVLFLGKYFPESLKNDLQLYIDQNDLQNNIELHSGVNYSEVSKYYNKSRIGIVTLLKSKTFEISLPIKLFEYMAFGLPIIGSNFGHIKNYIENENCGIVVDPMRADQIAKAMIELLSNPKKYKLYSENGRNATLKKYRWEMEFEKLLHYYSIALEERDKNNEFRKK